MSVSSIVCKVKSLWRRGWMEIPEIMASSSLAVLGIVMSLSTYVIQENRGGWNQKYMLRPMIIRPDDPRVHRIKRISNLDT